MTRRVKFDTNGTAHYTTKAEDKSYTECLELCGKFRQENASLNRALSRLVKDIECGHLVSAPDGNGEDTGANEHWLAESIGIARAALSKTTS